MSGGHTVSTSNGYVQYYSKRYKMFLLAVNRGVHNLIFLVSSRLALPYYGSVWLFTWERSEQSDTTE